MTAPAVGVRRGASSRVGAPTVGPPAQGVRAALARRRAEAGGWTPALVAILVYFFVVHSFRLPIGTAAIVSGLVLLVLEGRPMRVPAFLGWFAAFLAWALVAMPAGLDLGSSWTRWQDYGKIWLIAFLVYNAATSEKQWRIVVIGWLAMFALFPYRGTVFNFLGGIAHAGRYAWNFTFQNPNDLAAIALLVLALCVMLVRAPRPAWVRWCARLGAVSLPVLMLLTGSRGGLLGLAVFGVVLVLFSKRRLGILALSALATALAFPLLPANIKQRFLDMKFLQSTETLGQADSSAEQRWTIMRVAFAVASDHPLMGVGIGNYPLANARYSLLRAEWADARGFRDAHSTYLTVAAETGVPGLLLMGAATGSLLLALAGRYRRGVELARRLTDPVTVDALVNRPPALIAGTAAFLVASVFGSFIFMVFPFLFAVVALGVTESALRTAHGAVAPAPPRVSRGADSQRRPQRLRFRPA